MDVKKYYDNADFVNVNNLGHKYKGSYEPIKENLINCLGGKKNFIILLHIF